MRGEFIAASCVLSLAACHRLFGVDGTPADVAVDATTCFPPLVPGGDEDHDGVLDEVDPCPRVPFEDSHDEDGDELPDVCDPCPTLASAGVDLDCDGLGAACDPDDQVAHVIELVGFGEAGMLRILAAAFTGDAVTIPSSGNYGYASVVRAGSMIGSYETAGELDARTSYSTTALLLNGPTTATSYSIQIGGTTTGARFDVLSQDNQVLGTVDVGTLPAQVPFQLRVAVFADRIDATAVLDGIGKQVSAPITSTAMTEYGVGAYRDDATGGAQAKFFYLRRVTLAPPI